MGLTGPAASAGAVRALLRRFGHRRTSAAGRGATVVLGGLGLYVGAGVVWWLFTLPPTVLSAASPVAAQSWSPTWGWAALAAAAAAGIAVARAVGPVTCSAEFGFWLVSTPLDRGALLRRRVGGVLVCGAVAGAVAGRLAAFAGAVVEWVPFTVLAAALGAGTAALAVLVQCRVVPSRALWMLLRGCLTASGAAVFAAAAGVDVPAPTGWPAVLAAGAGCAAAVVLAARWCGRIGAADLATGTETAGAVTSSAVALDPTVAIGALERRAWRRVGSRRTRTLPRGLGRALIRADLLRYRRRPVPLLVAGAAVASVAVAAVPATPPAVAVWQLGVVFVVAMLFGAGLGDVCRDREFGMLLGAGHRHLVLPLTVVPGLAAMMAAVPTLVVSGGTVAVVVLVGACGAAYRVRTRPAFRYDGLIVETAVGQIPVDLLRQWLRGPDVLLGAAWLVAVLA